MHFPHNTLVGECEDDRIPWTDDQRLIFKKLCDRFSLVRSVKGNTSWGLYRGHYEGLFDHTNAWFDVNGRVVVSTCPYNHIKNRDVLEYALWMDWVRNGLCLLAEEHPEQKKSPDMRHTERFSFLDHIFVAPYGYHHPQTILIVLDADAMDTVKAIRRHMDMCDGMLVDGTRLFLNRRAEPLVWEPSQCELKLYTPMAKEFIRPARHIVRE